MRRIKVRFREDPKEEDISVLVSAKERDGEVEALLERISGDRMDRFAVINADGATVRLQPDEIIRVSMRKNQAKIETQTGCYTVRQTLQTIERALEGFRFLRISHSELVNMDMIEKIDFTSSRELRLELTGGIESWASRRYIPLIREELSRKEESVWSGKF